MNFEFPLPANPWVFWGSAYAIVHVMFALLIHQISLRQIKSWNQFCEQTNHETYVLSDREILNVFFRRLVGALPLFCFLVILLTIWNVVSVVRVVLQPLLSLFVFGKVKFWNKFRENFGLASPIYSPAEIKVELTGACCPPGITHFETTYEESLKLPKYSAYHCGNCPNPNCDPGVTWVEGGDCAGCGSSWMKFVRIIPNG